MLTIAKTTKSVGLAETNDPTGLRSQVSGVKGQRTNYYTMGPHSQLKHQPPMSNHTSIIGSCQEHSLENPKSL